ncbi:SWIM zinc finger family protein [Actinoalloteichus fjordicus]|uniref:SWIM-type domain-containing protein n=1 Tax=Actinoalloteichus fjordicus TaxID=1612552 RepID=A0AAC9LCN6_9PSEU|nr:hypothetical protein [Actinoalloteichus fjordicus]APU15147.1 hypothetical protein UA74_15470 [Actinoalloteichus fjordicus]
MTPRRAEPALGFPPFPPGRIRRTRTWWGTAWTKAMEDTSLDVDQLRRGRRHAIGGRVESITVSPGRLAALVHDTDGSTHHSVVHLEQLSDRDWDRFLDQVAVTAGHVAALVDRDMPRELVDVADDAGVRLLPGPGDLEPECDCVGFEHPCRHAAALSYQAGWLVDADPFVLFLLRGRERAELLDELQTRTATEPRPADRHSRPDPTAPPPGGVPAAQSYARPVSRMPPPPPPIRDNPPTPMFGSAPGIPPAALTFLAADAAHRAAALLTATTPPPALDRRTDAIRLAATYDDPALHTRLNATTEDPAAFATAVRAWQLGGPAGLAALETVWTPTAAQAARARDALTAYRDEERPGHVPELRAWRNRWTADDRGLQLRLGRDDRWYPFHRVGDSWQPAAAPGTDPTAALADLLAG